MLVLVLLVVVGQGEESRGCKAKYDQATDGCGCLVVQLLLCMNLGTVGYLMLDIVVVRLILLGIGMSALIGLAVAGLLLGVGMWSVQLMIDLVAAKLVLNVGVIGQLMLRFGMIGSGCFWDLVCLFQLVSLW